MKRCYVYLLSTTLLLLALVLPGRAQQNFFNIPSGDITPKNKVFYQHQLNVYSNKFESKGHFVYGIGGGWDIGMNIVSKGATFRPYWQWAENSRLENGALGPVALATIQKQFKISEKVAVNFGTQSGVNLSRYYERREFAHFTYALANYYVAPGRKIVGGAYATNRALNGPGNDLGLFVGYEWKLTEKWYLMGDWLSGRNDTGVGVFGFMWWASPKVQFCAGALVPNPGVAKAPGAVLEINLLGWTSDGH